MAAPDPSFGMGLTGGPLDTLEEHMTVRTRLGDHWTAAQDEQLRAMARENTPWNVIAEKLAHSPEAVFQRAHELGIKMRWSETSASVS